MTEPTWDLITPQVPITGSVEKATFALASAAYRDDEVGKILEANNEWHESTVKPPRKWATIFRPNLGEAFSQAVVARMLGVGRKPVVQSFGIEPQTVVEHCMAANNLRRQRDRKLTAVMLLCGVLFLPGTLVWLLVFQIRTTIAKRDDKRASGLATTLLVAVGALAVLFLIRMPFTGFWAWYARLAVVAPVVGWVLAKQICERSATDLRARWDSLLSGGTVGAQVPQSVPTSPGDTRADRLRQAFGELNNEQRSNSVFYAGPKGILGMGTRWGHWYLAEDLIPHVSEKEETDPLRVAMSKHIVPEPEIDRFQSFDVVSAIERNLAKLNTGPLTTGGFPKPKVSHWVVSHIGAGAKEISRPGGTTAHQINLEEIRKICNTKQYDTGDRHYLGVQWTLWDGQLVITMMVSVTVLHKTLRIELTGHALGPVNGLFSSKPAAKEREVAHPVRFWETRKVKLPLVDSDEVVRLTARAPLTWYPPLLNWLGGSMALPEPFGLRHAWADQPWKHRFMTDDVLRTATPVLRVVHESTIEFLKGHNVNTEKFDTRSTFLSGNVQDPMPKKDDVYDA
ncbi:hypothetical protein ABZT17_32280 [Streptomyces sp. NPDC005648]|uniref:hypothetical protein n=1 Tax=Streptomyces sp. NPDC005648 TaxID=3157044 RepID=UPI0033AEF9FB